MPLSPSARERYARHLLLPGFGHSGQQKLMAARILVVGAGGLGAPVLSYLAAAGVGHITVIDDDVVDSSNLQRQVIHTVDRIGQPKVDSARGAILGLSPDISLVTIQERLTAENAVEVVQGHDLVIDGTDNFGTRYLLNDLCVALGLPYVWAAIFQYDATLSVFDAAVGPCYRCLHPSPPPAGAVPSCADGGVLGVLPGHIGTAQATEAIKVLTGVGAPLIGRVATYSALSGEWDYIPLAKSPNCPACSSPRSVKETLVALESTLTACNISAVAPDRVGTTSAEAHQGGTSSATSAEESVIDPVELSQWLKQEGALLIDVRSVQETQIVSIPGATHIPLAQLIAQPEQIAHSQSVVIYCKSGARSAQAASALRQHGHQNVLNLAGGVLAWVQKVSPHEATY